MEIIQSDYVDISFTKANKRRVAEETDSENHYAAVVHTEQDKIAKEKVYRVTADHLLPQKNSKPVHVKYGDILIGESELEGKVSGTLYQLCGGMHKKLNISTTYLLEYVKVSSSNDETPIDNDDDGSEIYVNQEEVFTCSSVKKEAIVKPTIAVKNPSLTKAIIDRDPENLDKELAKKNDITINDIINAKFPGPEKWKILKEDKIPLFNSDNPKEIMVFALTDMKKSKEVNRLIFRKLQTGRLLYAINNWWYIETESSKGWSPHHYWRIVPVSNKDNIASPDYLPWNKTMISLQELTKHFETAAEGEFAMKTISGNQVCQLDVWVRNAQVTNKFSISINEENGHVTSMNGSIFKSIINFVLYYKSHCIPPSTSLMLRNPISKL